MQTNTDILYLLINATWVVQLVILILLIASVTSWTFIFNKWRELKYAKQLANRFESQFWSGIELSQVYAELTEDERNFGITAIFQVGFVEFSRLQKEGMVTIEKISDNVVRAMKVALSRESERHERHLNFLATVGSTSPYIGLFGTVWGIMDAFLALRNVQQATLSLVAPGIAEALIATAMGLLAAIPAVIAYNRFLDRADRVIAQYQNFIEEFTVILNQQTNKHS